MFFKIKFNNIINIILLNCHFYILKKKKKSISIDLIPKEIQNVISYLPSDQIYLLSNGKEIRSNKLNQFMQEVIHEIK